MPTATSSNSTNARKRLPAFEMLGFRIQPDSEAPQFYCLISAESELPVTIANDVALFLHPEDAAAALRAAGVDPDSYDPLPSEPAVICDVAGALFRLESAPSDADAVILNCINTLLDCVKATDLNLSESSRQVLHAVADHLTFSRDVEAIRVEERDSARDAILWIVGALAVRSCLVRSSVQ